jgi:16S rRNA U516 pseudouridylate synthase RsuA-like enzyme
MLISSFPSLLSPCSHGFCKRSEAKSWVRHGRVTFEGETVKKPDHKVVVRCVTQPVHIPFSVAKKNKKLLR